MLLLRPSGNCWGVKQEAGLPPQAEVIEMNGWPKLSTRPSCRLVGIGVSLGYVGLKAPTSLKKIWLHLGFLPINRTEVT